MSTQTEPARAEVDAWQQWRAERAQTLSEPYGWLSLTAFHWLPDEPAELPGLPGLWWSAGGAAHLRAPGGDGLTADGAAVSGEVSDRVDEAGSLVWVAHRDYRVELLLRGGRYAVRVRDPRAATLTGFTAVPVFEHDPAWVVQGHLVAQEPRSVEVGTARPDLVQRAEVVGTVHLEVEGRTHELAATRGPGGSVLLAFRDETSGAESAPWRVVPVGEPDEDGRVVVDLNRAANLPFAFTDHGTCPAPVAGNVLPVAVTAGERRPR